MIKGVNEAHFELLNSELLGLAWSFSVNPNSCENSEFYSEYLRFTAMGDQISGHNTTHLFIDDDTKQLMGFISLRASSIISEDDSKAFIGIPALEISMLAVDEKYERRGVGSALIDYAIATADELHKSFIGIQHIVLAADKLAVGFYKRMDFVPMEDRWKHIPKEQFSTSCVPMDLQLDYGMEAFEPFPDDEDDEE